MNELQILVGLLLLAAIGVVIMSWDHLKSSINSDDDKEVIKKIIKEEQQQPVVDGPVKTKRKYTRKK